MLFQMLTHFINHEATLLSPPVSEKSLHTEKLSSSGWWVQVLRIFHLYLKAHILPLACPGPAGCLLESHSAQPHQQLCSSLTEYLPDAQIWISRFPVVHSCKNVLWKKWLAQLITQTSQKWLFLNIPALNRMLYAYFPHRIWKRCAPRCNKAMSLLWWGHSCIWWQTTCTILCHSWICAKLPTVFCPPFVFNKTVKKANSVIIKSFVFTDPLKGSWGPWVLNYTLRNASLWEGKHPEFR